MRRAGLDLARWRAAWPLVLGVVLLTVAGGLAVALLRKDGDVTPAALPTVGAPGPVSTVDPTDSAPSSSAAPSTAAPGPAGGCAADPGACGFPTPATAGVPAGMSLTVVNGDLEVTANGTVIEYKEIRGCVDVQADGVTIRHSRILCPGSIAVATWNGGAATIERVEISCVTGEGTGIAGPDFIARAVHIHDCENGLEINANSSISDSVISAREGSPDGHGDGIQSQGGDNVVSRHNTLLLVNPVTSAIITHPTDNNGWLVEENLMGGGAYTIYCPEQGSDFVVRNNRFVPAKRGSRHSAAYGLTDECGHGGITFTGNVLDTDGRPVRA